MNRKIYIFIKRLFDVTLSLVGILFTLPIALIIKASFILTKDYNSIFFYQDRLGKYGKVFKLYKFRSMSINNNVKDFSKEDEYTKVGKIIRKLSLDELPQMINILKGEMSFIGPRPWITDYYDNMNEVQKQRFNVLPGMSGLAQVKGRNNISIIEKINYDLEYIEKASLIEDIYIIFKTFQKVLLQEGVNAGKSIIKSELEMLKQNNLYSDAYNK